MGREDAVRPRRNKVPRYRFQSNDDDDEDDDDDDECDQYKKQQQRKQSYISQRSNDNKKNKKPKADIRQNDNDNNYSNNHVEISQEDLPSYDEIEDHLLAYCCANNCYCNEEQKEWVTADGRDNYITASNESLWHRRCCHSVYDYHSEWLSPMEQIFEKKEAYLINQSTSSLDHNHHDDHDNDDTTIFLMNGKDASIVTKYHTAKSHESALRNEDTMPDPFSALTTCPRYVKSMIEFQKSITAAQHQTILNRNDDNAAVVLDLFGGIGTAIVSLKRLGIAMKKIIHIDHDFIARHVHQWNHDPTYHDLRQRYYTDHNITSPFETNNNDHGIEHIYDYNRFEDIYGTNEDLEAFLEKHGPIDIVVGGPPCVDYSGANAFRQGTDGNQGSYMIKLGHFVKMVQAAQERKLYYLAENAVVRNGKELPLKEGDLEKVLQSFGESAHHIVLDSRDYSPCRRNRSYITNIPHVLAADDIEQFKEECCRGFQSTVVMCLDDGFVHPANIIERHLPTKSNCFMAHTGRVDDKRMLVCREVLQMPNLMVDTDKHRKWIEGQDFECRYITTNERELMMGLPRHYVEAPVHDLFENILKGLGNCLQFQTYWKQELDQRYHKFSGNFHKLDTQRVEQPIILDFDNRCGQILFKLPIPQTTQTPLRFDKDGYAKHLVGNAFSVPVVTILLQPLKQVFATRKYPSYDYQYPWMK